MKIQQASSNLSLSGIFVRKACNIDMCAAKTHSHSQAIATLQPNAYFFKKFTRCLAVSQIFQILQFDCLVLVLLALHNWHVKSIWQFQLSLDFWIFCILYIKKVSKLGILCEINCVSKRTRVILIRMLGCTAFFKAKIFLSLFLFSFVRFVSGQGI